MFILCIMVRLLKPGDIKLAQQLEKEGYEWLINNHS